MLKLKPILLTVILFSLYGCTPPPSSSPVYKKPIKQGYLKTAITQKELNNTGNFKRYSYRCHNISTGNVAHLATYFPLSRESRLKENFGFYFQLDGGIAHPFDHLENRPLNARGTKFEVLYRSYYSIDGAYVNLTARENSSIYHKNGKPWLKCRES